MNQSKQLFGYQQKPKKKRTRTIHTIEQSNALRKQLLVWLYSNRNSLIKYVDVFAKCEELKISRTIYAQLITLKILIKNKYGGYGYNWNPDIVSPDFTKLCHQLNEAEKEFKEKSRLRTIEKNKNFQSLKSLKNQSFQIEYEPFGVHQISEINQKLDLICKALGLC